MNKSHALHAAQRGATLLVALIFLLVMTIAGITAMRFATFEERMASNTETSNEMFQQAQSEIQARLLEFNSGVAQQAALLLAQNQPPDSGDREQDPILKSLPDDIIPLATIYLDETPPPYIDGNNTLRSVSRDSPCNGGSADLGSTVKCDDYEMQITAQNGTAKSWQTQGISLETN